MSRATDRKLMSDCVISLNKLIVYLESRNDCKELLDQLIQQVINPFNSKSMYKSHEGLMQFLKDNEYNFPTDFEFSHWNLACKNLISVLDKIENDELDNIKQEDDIIKQRDLGLVISESVVNRRLDRQILLLSVLETISYRYNCELNSSSTPLDFTMWQVNLNAR